MAITAVVPEVYRDKEKLKLTVVYKDESGADIETEALETSYNTITDAEQITKIVNDMVKSKNALEKFKEINQGKTYSPVVSADIGTISYIDKTLRIEKDYLKTKAIEYIYSQSSVIRTDMVKALTTTRITDAQTILIDIDALIETYIQVSYNSWCVVNPQTGSITPAQATDVGAQRFISAPTFDVFVATIKAIPPNIIATLEL